MTLLIIFGVLMVCSSQSFAVRYEVNEAIDNLKSYDSAVSDCESKGGYLMRPKSDEDVRNLMEAHNLANWRTFWIGIRSEDGDRWTYNNGETLTEWAETLISDAYDYDYYEDDDPTKCITLSMPDYAGIDPCYRNTQYVCEFPEECPEDFDQVGDVCLALVEEEKSYTAARDHCSNIGARLTTPTTEALYNQLFAWDQMDSRPQLTIWLGLSNLGQVDQSNYSWENEEQTPLAQTWSSFKDDRVRPKDSTYSVCVTARNRTPKMRGFNCETRSYPFVCETRLG